MNNDRKPRILIVDDEPLIHQTLIALLHQEDYELIHAGNGLEGLAVARELQPDAVLLDVMMPGMDGFAVARAIRDDRLLAKVPILMITSLDDRTSRLAGLNAGADDFLTKPFDTIELMTRLRTIVRLNRYRTLVEQRNMLQKVNVDLRSAYSQTIEGWSRAMDLRDHETEGHTLRVTEMTIQLARLIGIDGGSLEPIRHGALLHDMGKLGIPDSVLFKPGPLTPEEWEIMKQHPVYANELLSPIEYLYLALDIPYCHHERWDGSGYPRGLKGEQIPLAARLFAIVDVWDAMRSERPYRKAMADQDVLRYITEQKGILFDSMLVDVFIKHIGGGTIPPLPEVEGYMQS